MASHIVYRCDVCREGIDPSKVCTVEVSFPAYAVKRDVHEECLRKLFDNGGGGGLLKNDQVRGIAE